MATHTESATGSKKLLWTGRAITGLAVLTLVVSGVLKLMGHDGAIKELTRLGWPADYTYGLGILEIACAIIYAIPQTAVLGAILLTGYLGGASATHLRIDDPFYAPVIVGVLVWLGIYLRDARLRALVPWRP